MKKKTIVIFLIIIFIIGFITFLGIYIARKVNNSQNNINQQPQSQNNEVLDINKALGDRLIDIPDNNTDWITLLELWSNINDASLIAENSIYECTEEDGTCWTPWLETCVENCIPKEIKENISTQYTKAFGVSTPNGPTLPKFNSKSAIANLVSNGYLSSDQALYIQTLFGLRIMYVLDNHTTMYKCPLCAMSPTPMEYYTGLKIIEIEELIREALKTYDTYEYRETMFEISNDILECTLIYNLRFFPASQFGYTGNFDDYETYDFSKWDYQYITSVIYPDLKDYLEGNEYHEMYDGEWQNDLQTLNSAFAIQTKDSWDFQNAFWMLQYQYEINDK